MGLGQGVGDGIDFGVGFFFCAVQLLGQFLEVHGLQVFKTFVIVIVFFLVAVFALHLVQVVDVLVGEVGVEVLDELVIFVQLVSVDLQVSQVGQWALQQLVEPRQVFLGQLVVLQLQLLQRARLGCVPEVQELVEAVRFQQTVVQVQLGQVLPVGEVLADAQTAQVGQGVVLQVQHTQLAVELQAVNQRVDADGPDAVLVQAQFLQVPVVEQAEGQVLHGAVLQAVSAANERLQRSDALGLLEFGELVESLADAFAGERAHAVVGEHQVLQAVGAGQVVLDGLDGLEAEGVVAQVESLQVGALQQHSEEMGQALRHLGVEARRVDVQQVDVLQRAAERLDGGGDGGGGVHADGVAGKIDLAEPRARSQRVDHKRNVVRGVELQLAARDRIGVGGGHGDVHVS